MADLAHAQLKLRRLWTSLFNPYVSFLGWLGTSYHVHIASFPFDDIGGGLKWWEGVAAVLAWKGVQDQPWCLLRCLEKLCLVLDWWTLSWGQLCMDARLCTFAKSKQDPKIVWAQLGWVLPMAHLALSLHQIINLWIMGFGAPWRWRPVLPPTEVLLTWGSLLGQHGWTCVWTIWRRWAEPSGPGWRTNLMQIGAR